MPRASETECLAPLRSRSLLRSAVGEGQTIWHPAREHLAVPPQKPASRILAVLVMSGLLLYGLFEPWLAATVPWFLSLPILIGLLAFVLIEEWSRRQRTYGDDEGEQSASAPTNDG